MAQTFRKKPVQIQAVQWTGDNAHEVIALAGDHFEVVDPMDRHLLDDPEATASVLAAPHSSWVLVYTGDWVIQEPDGSGFYPCRGYVFDETYEPVET